MPESVTEGDTVTLTAQLSASLQARVDANAPTTWQWRKDGADISGATGTTLLLNPVALTDAGSYQVLVTISGTPLPVSDVHAYGC